MPNNYLFGGVLIILVVLLVIHLLSRYESLHPPRRRSAPPPPQVEQVPPAPPPPAEPEPDPVQSPEDLFCQPIYEKYVEGRFSHLLAIAIQGVVMEQSAAVSVVEKALGARNAYRQSAKYLDYMLEAGVIAENQYGDRRVVITNRYFTTGAKALAKATDVLLWDRDRLKRIIQATEKQ